MTQHFAAEIRRQLPTGQREKEEEALEEAWNLAQGENEIVAIEGPDDETVPMLEIEAWFESRSASGNTEAPS